MDKNPVKSDKPPVYIHRTEAEKTEIIMVRVTPFEKEFFQTLATILSELVIDGKALK